MAKLLIVEDEENQRVLYKQEFEDDGYEVILAADGPESIDMVEKEKPDLVILDISMPGMDGIEALGKILGKDNRMPIILHTAYSNYKDNFMSWSADAYIVKSSDLTELKAEVRHLLARDKE